MDKERLVQIGKFLNYRLIIHRNVENNTPWNTEEKMIQELYDSYLDLLIKHKKQKEAIDRILNETEETRNILNNNRDDNILSKSCLLSYLEIVEDLLKENQELKKQVEEYENELEKADSITQSCIFNGKKESEISYRKCLNMLEKHNNQQKDFINFLEDNYKETQDIWYIKILQKYKSIIGGKE